MKTQIDRRTFLIGTVGAAAAASVPTTAFALGGSARIRVGDQVRSWSRDGALFEIRPEAHEVARLSPRGRALWTARVGDRGLALNSPWEAAVAPDGRLYVVDRGNHRVTIFSGDGAVLGSLGGSDSMHMPIDVAVDRAGVVYVLEPYDHRIGRFDRRGAALSPISLQGINFPLAFHLDPEGRLQVTDFDGGITVLGRDGRSVAAASTDLSAPGGVAVDHDGNRLVAATADSALRVVDRSGKVRSDVVVRLDGVPAHPTHLAWAPDGSLYVRVLPTG